jgi:hypothetical protein
MVTYDDVNNMGNQAAKDLAAKMCVLRGGAVLFGEYCVQSWVPIVVFVAIGLLSLCVLYCFFTTFMSMRNASVQQQQVRVVYRDAPQVDAQPVASSKV